MKTLLQFIGINEDLDVKTLTVSQLAKLHSLPESEIEDQLAKGVKVESEHTTDPKVAAEIARDHIKENPKYYDKLAKVEEAHIGQITGIPSQKKPPGTKKPLGGKAEVRTDLVHAPGYGKVTQAQYDDLKKRGVIESDTTCVWEALVHPIRAIHVSAHKDGGHTVTIKKRDGVAPVIKHHTGEDSYEKAMGHANAVAKTTDGEVVVHDLTEDVEVPLDESLSSRVTKVSVREHPNGGSSVVIGVDGGGEHIVKTHGTPEAAFSHAEGLRAHHKVKRGGVHEASDLRGAMAILETLRAGRG